MKFIKLPCLRRSRHSSQTLVKSTQKKSKFIFRLDDHCFFSFVKAETHPSAITMMNSTVTQYFVYRYNGLDSKAPCALFVPSFVKNCYYVISFITAVCPTPFPCRMACYDRGELYLFKQIYLSD